ncbi:MAG: TPM domain-containing protein [Candidatus Eremiobacteraeota bacterium]|nr:TPM domain-containing protein [Candidatus Eremiobacteraeota bacterium]
MRYFSPFIALVAIGFLAAPAAAARSSFVLDGAGMFSAGTVSALNTRLTNFNAQTHKEVLVETVPSLNGATLQDAAQREFAQQQVDGVMIFIAKDERRDIIVPDRAGVQAGWFDSETLRSIRQSMESQFKDGDFDGGITTAVNGILGIYRSHMSSLNGANGAALPATRSYNSRAANPTFHLNGFWLVVILIAAFLVLRSLMRAMSAPRQYVGAPGAPGRPPAPTQGYGPGYYGGGGGGFWSGLLGGLGGAWLGNEMFRGRGDASGGASAGGWGGGDAGGSGGGDSGGWSSDAGQADVGGSSGGDWSGGGFGGDGGGGFGGDGGGGGDSGGGW